MFIVKSWTLTFYSFFYEKVINNKIITKTFLTICFLSLRSETFQLVIIKGEQHIVIASKYSSHIVKLSIALAQSLGFKRVINMLLIAIIVLQNSALSMLCRYSSLLR